MIVVLCEIAGDLFWAASKLLDAAYHSEFLGVTPTAETSKTAKNMYSKVENIFILHFLDSSMHRAINRPGGGSKTSIIGKIRC